MNRRIGSLAAAALSLMAAAPAHATTVSNTSGVLEIEARGYGVNDITITQTPIAYPSAGQILVTDRTMRAVEHIAEGRLVDEITLQGVSRPIKIYEVVAPSP